jgi:NTP pyrophosphatase (non-canonical NTP hydrolase)
MNYLEESARTASGHFHGELVTRAEFLDQLDEAILALIKLDRIKKLLFYGEDVTKGRVRTPISSPTETMLGTQDLEILHGILGVATEAGELLEALKKSELDHVNIGEEIGDMNWYEAMLLRKIGKTFEQVQETNICKLRIRFPDKFTTDDANNRDLSAERFVLR